MKLYKGWQVALAGLGINFLSGVSYAWSIFAGELVQQYGWTQAQSALPYTVFMLCYAPSMIIGGATQDKVGPRFVIAVGGVLIGASFIISSFFKSPIWVAVIWGMFFGLGLAFCFGSVTPAAMKWFPLEKRGLVAGVVFNGVGLSGLVLSPLLNILARKGISLAFLVTGTVLLVGILILSKFVINPPAVTEGELNRAESVRWFSIMQTKQFYFMWLMFCLTAASGLTFATHLVRIAKVQASFDKGYILVSLFAFFNAVGRLLAGYLSDVIGRKRTMTLNFSIMAVVLFLSIKAITPAFLAVSVSLLALTYSSIYSLFPAVVSTLYGDQNFGLNYGLLFTAIGVAGLFPLKVGYLFDLYGNFTLAFIILSIFCVLASGISLFLKNSYV